MKKRILFLSILAGLGAVWSPAAAASPETPAAENAINAAAGPFGILSVILIIIVGAVLYFGVLPKVMTNDERKI